MRRPTFQAETTRVPPIRFCQLLADEYTSQLSDLELLLTSDELERARRFARSQDRIQFVLGRAAVRHICSETFKIKPTAVKIELSESGKPHVTWPDSRFEFNISHGNGIVVIAWNDSCPVGVDVESTDETIPVHEISQVALSRTECDVLSMARADQLQQVFCRLWVRKEAVLKAEGCGICCGLRTFSTVHKYNSRIEWPSSLLFPWTMRLWKIVDLLLPPKYIVALAIPPFAELVLCTPEEIGLTRSVPESPLV